MACAWNVHRANRRKPLTSLALQRPIRLLRRGGRTNRNPLRIAPFRGAWHTRRRSNRREEDPMPETLILHLGLHKTATTALQEFLAGEPRALLAHGVVYPRLARMRSDLTPLIASAGQARPRRARPLRRQGAPAGAAHLRREHPRRARRHPRRRALPLRREPDAPLLRPVRRPAHPAVPDAARAGRLPRLDVLRVPAAQPLPRLRRLRPRLRPRGLRLRRRSSTGSARCRATSRSR